jgi:hypothetical protein
MQNQNRLPAAPPSRKSSKGGIQAQSPWTLDDKKSLAVVIGRVFDLQKQFGKTTGQLENIVEGFCWAMQAYPVERVVWGFGQYILQRSDMPTPADIRQIIDPIKAPWKPDKAYYISLKQIHKEQGPYGLDLDEIEYIRAYEEHMRNERHASEQGER